MVESSTNKGEGPKGFFSYTYHHSGCIELTFNDEITFDITKNNVHLEIVGPSGRIDDLMHTHLTHEEFQKVIDAFKEIQND